MERKDQQELYVLNAKNKFGQKLKIKLMDIHG